MIDAESLDAALRAAHQDVDGGRLSELYALAADHVEQAGDTDAACFFLTQSWIFALQTDHPIARVVHERLVGHGRV